MKKEVKSTLGEFFDESVPSAIKRTVMDNTPFKIVENGKTYYVGMLLDTVKIGGINKKSQNNAQIGGMIECVKGQKIDLFMTAELIESGELLFIPTPTTFDGLADYGLFTNCKDYEFVKLNSNLDIVERTGILATYADFREISSGQVSITDYLQPPEDESESEISSEPESESEPDSESGLDPMFELGVEPVDTADAAINADGESSSGSEAVSEEPVAEQGAAVFNQTNTEATKSDTASASNHGLMAQAADKMKSVAAAAVDKMSNLAQSVAEKVADSTGYKDMVGDTKKSNHETTSGTSAVSQTTSASVQQSAENMSADEEQDVVYTEIQVESSISRIFHADNLDLPVSSEPFDQLFTLNNQLIRFDVDSRDTYVNERLNMMATDANRDLQKLRTDNLRKLREKYFMLMSVRVLEIQKELDINNQDTEYGSQKWALENTRKDKLDHVNALIEEKRKALEDDFNRRRDEYCDAEARKARTDFNAKFQRAHNDDMNKIDGVVKSEIQSEYERDLHSLYTARRNEALTLLDLNITGVLKELAKDYSSMFDEENALYAKRADEMRAYAKELHAEDAKRLAIEEERNRISNEVNDARAEAAAKIDLLKKEYETAQAALEARSQATITQAENQNQLLKEQMAERTTALEQDKENLQKQLDDAIRRSVAMQETIKADYEHRLIQAMDDRDSWKQTFDSYKEQHKHNSRLAAILVVAITIAAIAGGFVAGGVYWNRTVAGELAGNKTPTEINIIKPETTVESEVLDIDAVTSAAPEVPESSVDNGSQTVVVSPDGSEVSLRVTVAVADDKSNQSSATSG